MRQLLLIVVCTVSLSACFQWKGDGTDEVLPDAIGIASGGKVKPAFGVPSGSYNDHADVDIKENRGGEAHEGGAVHEAPHGSMPHSAGGPSAPPPPKDEE